MRDQGGGRMTGGEALASRGHFCVSLDPVVERFKGLCALHTSPPRNRWQTETGGHMITPLPGATPLKPGSASLPFFGVEPVVGAPLRVHTESHDSP